MNLTPELTDEILQAPWNTTRAYLGALKGRCLMQVFGIGGERCAMSEREAPVLFS